MENTDLLPTRKKASEAQLRASKKWNEKQAQIAIRVSPELKEAVDTHIAAQGETLAGFIVRAISEQIKRDDPLATVPTKVAAKSCGKVAGKSKAKVAEESPAKVAEEK